MMNLLMVLIGLGALGIEAFPQLNFKDARSATTQAKTAEDCPHLAKNKQVKRQLPFDPATQHVSTTGQHAWVAPNFALGDQRGPCPGLNALANHGYLPHNGVADILTITDAVNAAYGMAADLGGFLAVFGTLFDGNALSLSPGYSIGGPTASETILSGLGLLGTAPGLSGSHGNYEGDASPTRGDLYVTGDNFQLRLDQFQRYYDALPDNMASPRAAPDQYSALLPFRQARFNDSITGNPYFFYPPFAGILVNPAGYTFPCAMMANHSTEYPEGYLDKETFKSFFAVSGDSGSFTYKAGYERIPDNWYKRSVADEYTIPGYVADVVLTGIQDPKFLSIGGNTGSTNSFVGLDLASLTGGVFNSATLTKGNNFECFLFQVIQAEAPSFLASRYGDVTKALQPLLQIIASNLNGLSCPQLKSFDTSQYNPYPGYTKAKGAMK